MINLKRSILIKNNVCVPHGDDGDNDDDNEICLDDISFIE